MQRASKLLAPKCSGQLNVFLLVEKKQKDPDDSDYDPVMPYCYAPLIDHCAVLYPDIKVNCYALALVLGALSDTDIRPSVRVSVCPMAQLP